MLPISMIVLVASIAFSIVAWMRGRPKVWLFPSDALFLSCVIMVGVAPLLNVHADTDYNVSYQYRDADIARALFAASIMFVVFGAIWILRPVIKIPRLMEAADQKENIPILLVFGTFALCVLSVFLFLDLEYRQFRMEFLRYITGQMSQGEYQYARRFAHGDHFIIAQVVSRMRYSVFAFLIAISAAYGFRKFNPVFVVPVLAVEFFLLSSSVSKLTSVMFVIYPVLTYLLVRQGSRILKMKYIVPVGSAFIVLVFGLMVGLYMIQYPEIFVGLDGIVEAGKLTNFRLFGASYDALLQYFTVYPNGYDFTYFTDSRVVAGILGVPVRDVNMEIPKYFVGFTASKLTSTPTIFIGSAYASLGYFGVALFSVVVGVLVCWIDHIVVSLKNGYLRAAFYSVMVLNVTFFSMIAGPTTLLTYGCGVIPLVALFIDRLFNSSRAISKLSPRGERVSGLRQAR